MSKRLKVSVKHFLGHSYQITDFEDRLPTVKVKGKLGPDSLNVNSMDLLDVATAIFFIEKSFRGSLRTNRVLKVEVELSLRDPGKWKPDIIKKLSDLLLFMGGVHWKFKFTKNKDLPIPTVLITDTFSIDKVSLFSGGLDSFCGATSILNDKKVVFASYYTRQKHQQTLLEALKLPPPIQFSFQSKGYPNNNKTFLYRSFLFIAIAGITANSYKANKILQFENGILASGVAPSINGRMTKHAHYKLHRSCEEIFSSILGGSWEIKNPFRLLTKREIFQCAIEKLGQYNAQTLGNKTDSCWNLFAGFKDKKRIKPNGVPCGFCVPCLIRNMAINTKNWKDLKKDETRNHEKFGRYFREYYSLVVRVKSFEKSTTGEFFKNLNTDYFDAIHPNGDYTPDELKDLLCRFSNEFIDTFKIVSNE